MSIHAQLSPEAQQRLDQQRKMSTIFSVVIAFLSIVVCALVLGIFLLPNIIKEVPVIVTYQSTTVDESTIETKKVTNQITRKPSSPSSSMAKVIAANTTSNVSIPVPEVNVDEISTEFGDGDDFGAGWNQVATESASEGTASAFGSTSPSSGGLEGFLYDLKQKPDGKEIEYEPKKMSDFADPVNRLQSSRFSASALGKFFRAPSPLYLTKLAIAKTSADQGPELFGGGDVIKPSGWIAHYKGKVVAPEEGKYRFAGIGDDYILVRVDGKDRLYGGLPEVNKEVMGGWRESEKPQLHSFPWRNSHLVHGDWINLRKGQEIDLEIIIGERPGGEVWFILQVEKDGEEYRKRSDGRPILPLFSTQPISEEDKSSLQKSFGDYEIEFDKVPVFSVK